MKLSDFIVISDKDINYGYKPKELGICMDCKGEVDSRSLRCTACRFKWLKAYKDARYRKSKEAQVANK